jgi:asparagine synthase (glutamine-hydrolysing)
MCGIAGAVDRSGAALDREALKAMDDSMRLRGPDDEGTFFDGACMLGQRRLSIIDLGGGHQPMATPDGKLVVTFNGEIYNFKELRARLEALGHHFSTNSDTESILWAYRQWGEACVRELDGMFAFALWDADNQKLLLGRDRFGKKPLFYFHDGERLIFASTLSALRCHPRVPSVLDPSAVAEYLALEYVVAPRSILRGVNKLPPASQLTFDARSGRVHVDRYWRLRVDGSLDISENEAAERLEALLGDAVRKRLIADVPLGVFLSGGIDSSTVAAVAAAQRSGVRTFSVRIKDRSFDESRFARLVAQHLGTDHVEEELSPDEAVQIAQRLGEILDEPVADGSVVPTYLLSRFARKHVTVALGGDGGDELFAGYPTYVAHRLAGWAGPFAHPALVDKLRQFVAHLPVSHDAFSFDFKLKKLLSGLDAPAAERNYVWLGAFERERLRRLMPGAEYDVYAPVRARYEEAGGTHLERVLYQDVGLYMCHSVLAKVDRASMANSLEVRAPLLDTALCEFVGRLPLKYKLRGFTGKWLLKQVARKKLPHEIVDRPKKGFGMPTGRWLRAELGDVVRSALTDGQSLSATGLFERRELELLLDEHARGVADHRQRLWSLYVLEQWQRSRPGPIRR